MKVFYWSPYLSHVATITAVLNSAISLKKYSKNLIDISIINSSGEWNSHKNDLSNSDIKVIDIFKKEFFKNLPRYGFIRSRFSYLKIFFLSFFSLKKLLNQNKPNFLIIHLITSLPLLLNFLFKFETKFILRISGYPKLNIMRKFLWKLWGKKLFKIVCPTEATKQYLIKKNIFDKSKIFVLKDPVINISKINLLKKNESSFFDKKKKYLLSIGRLSKQKNFLFLIKCFDSILKKYPDYKLVIIGEGELESEIKRYINNLKLNEKISIIPFQKNIFKYLHRSECFILSSLWEDPGFVLIEAASMGIPIISSNCPNGPTEFLENGEAGFLFKSNDINSMLDSFDKYFQSNKNDIRSKVLKAKKQSKSYSIFRHYLELNKILN